MVTPRMRHLLVAGGVGMAHVARLLLVGRALRERGQEVCFATGGDGRLARDEGFETFVLPEPAVTDFTQNIYAGYTPEVVHGCVAAESELLAAVRPDVVVADLRPTVAISARLAAVPYVAIVNGYMTRAFDPVDVLMPAGAATRRKRAAASFVGRRLQSVEKRDLAAGLRKVARDRGIEGLESLDDFLAGDLTLVADLPEFCALDGLDASTRYVGPLIWEPAGDDAQLPSGLDATRPLIYATIANTGPPQLADLVVEAFGTDRRFEVVLTTGAFVAPPAGTPANIHARHFVRGSDVLRRATVAIHCGGNGSTYQALAGGVPAVVVPHSNDQRINAHLVKRHGVGIALDVEKVTAEVLRAAVKMAMADTAMPARLLRFQELVLRSRGPQTAAAQIIALASRTP